MACVDDQAIAAFLAGDLADSDVHNFEVALDGCSHCFQLFTAVAHEQLCEDHARLQPGSTLGRYQIVDELGRGATATVLRAWDPQIDRHVAIKVLRTRRGVSTEKLLEEARVLGRLAHENVVRVFDVGQHKSGLVYIVMELVERGNLRDWLKRQRTTEEIVRVFRQAAAGLAAAHEANIVHGDFKPENVLVSESGSVRVTDFGLARFTISQLAPNTDHIVDLEVTQTRSLVGTPAYMAPEQFANRRATALSDQFAWGIALVEAITGLRPYPSDNLASLRYAVQNHPPTITGVPRRYQAVASRALRNDPCERYPATADLLQQLDRATHSRRRGRVAIGAAAIALVAFVTAWQFLPSNATSCASEANRVRTAFDHSQANDLDKKITATPVTFSAHTAKQVVTQLAKYRDGLAEGYRRVCRASQDKTTTRALAQKRTLCLEHRERSWRSLIAALSTAKPNALRHATQTVSKLPSIAVCDNLLAMDKITLPPPSEKATIDKALQFTADAATAIGLGDYDRAEELAKNAHRLADSITHHRTRTAILNRRFGVARIRGQSDVAKKILTDALVEAQASGESLLIAQIRLRAATFHITSLAWQPAQDNLRLARAAIAAAGGDTELELRAELLALHNLGNQGLSQEVVARAPLLIKKLAANGLLDDQDDAVSIYASSLAATGRFDDTLTLRKSLLQNTIAIYGPTHPNTGMAYGNLAYIYTRLDQYADAIRAAEKSYKILALTLKPPNEELARSLSNLGGILSSAGRLAEAIPHLERALTMRKTILGDDHARVGLTTGSLGVTFFRVGRLSRAKNLLLESVRILRQRLPAGHPQLLRMLGHLGDVLGGLKEYDSTMEILEELIAADPAAMGKFEYARTQYNLAQLLSERKNQHGRARKLAQASSSSLAKIQTPRGRTTHKIVQKWLGKHAR